MENIHISCQKFFFLSQFVYIYIKLNKNMAKLFYQTIEVSPELLKQYEKKAAHQEEVILSFFKQGFDLTRSEVWQIFDYNNYRISESSISRSLSNMSDRLQITKTGEKRIGVWGKKNSVYTLVTEENKEQAQKKLSRVRILLTQMELDALHLCINDFMKQNKDNDEYNSELFDILETLYNQLLNKIK